MKLSPGQGATQQSWMGFYDTTGFNGKRTNPLKLRWFKTQGLCSQITLLPGWVSLEGHPRPAMELCLPSPSALANVPALGTQPWLLCSTWQARAIRGSALIWTWEMKLRLHRREHASLRAPTPHGDPSVSVCGAKSTQLAEGWGGMAAMHSSILQFGLTYPQTRKPCGNHRLLWSPLRQRPCGRHARSFGTCQREQL